MGFGASSSGGARGEGGSGGAFGDRLGLGLTTGKTWHGTTAFGPAGGMAQGYGTRQADGSLGNLRDTNGNAFGSTRAMGGMPGGYAAPVMSRPLPPPPAIVPAAAPPPILARPPAPPAAPPPNAWSYMRNPTAYAQHTQNIPGHPGSLQSTYAPRNTTNVPQNNMGNTRGYGAGWSHSTGRQEFGGSR